MPFFGKLRFYLIDALRGTHVVQYLSLLNYQQYLSKDELIKIAYEKKIKIFEKAKTTVAYYKQFANNSTFPELNKDIIRAHMHEFVVPTYKGKLVKKSTGGSTGIPLLYYTTTEAQSFMWAGIIHSWKIAGYKLGDKVAFITGTALAKNDWRHFVFYQLMNINIYSAYQLDSNTIHQYLNKLIDTKTKIIYGYPTALNELALYLLKYKELDFPDLKGIIVTSEVLEDKHRFNIEKAFKVIVLNQYGCNEAGLSAFECEYGKLHLINTAAAIDIDENGVLYSTNLVNEGFYFINYNTGDTVKMSDHIACSCKRGFPIIDKVNGRSVDMIVDKTGKKIHSAFFSILFRMDSTVEQFQIQFDENAIHVFIKVNLSTFKKEHQAEYLRQVKKTMKFDEYFIWINKPFLKSINAKHKYVIDNRKISKRHENLV